MLKETFQISNTLEVRIENIVKEGYLQDNTEAVNEALRLLIRRYKAIEIGKDIYKLRVKAGRDINLTEEVMKTHEEEDELWSVSDASVGGEMV
jgi:Arc/MetJ-type ribon-helix-helix transcriptional regulator